MIHKRLFLWIWLLIFSSFFDLTDSYIQSQNVFLPNREVFGTNSRTHQISVAERPIQGHSMTQKEVSDLDREVLRDLLNDPTFIESLESQNQTVSQSLKDDLKKRPSSKSFVTSIEQEGEFQSSTFKKAEELQQSFGSFWGAFSAAVESAAIFVVNKVASDIKLVEATASYLSQRAIFDTRRTLSAASDVTRPLALLGQAAEEAKKSNLTLGQSAELLGLGLLDSVGEERRLGAFKSFDDPGKRLDRAYQQKIKKKGPALPIKAATALPELASKTYDLAYEVDREIKYEEPGRKVRKLAGQIGIDASFLLGPSAAQKALSQAKKASTSNALLTGSSQATTSTNYKQLDEVETATFQKDGLDVGTVQTYGELIQLLEEMNPQFSTFHEVDKLANKVYLDDFEAVLKSMATSIDLDKTVLEDLVEVADQIREDVVKAPLVEGIKTSKQMIAAKSEWREICLELDGAFNEWGQSFIAMNNDFQDALESLKLDDQDLFKEKAELEKPLPSQVEKYLLLLLKRLEEQRISQLKVVDCASKVLNFNVSSAMTALNGSNSSDNNAFKQLFPEDLKSFDTERLQQICTSLIEIPITKGLSEISLKCRPASAAPGGNEASSTARRNLRNNNSFNSDTYLGTIQEVATISNNQIEDSKATDFAVVDVIADIGTTVVVDIQAKNQEHDMQGASSPIFDNQSADISQKSIRIVDDDIIIPEVFKGGFETSSQPSTSSPNLQSSSLISNAYSTTTTNQSPQVLVRYGEDDAIDADAAFEKEDSEKAAELALKSLDILILLIEKLLTVGLPAVISISEVSTQRLQEIYSDGGKVDDGWQLLSGVRKK